MAIILYSAGEYILERTTHPKHRPFRVYNTTTKGHTHIKSEKEAKDLIHFAINKNIPLKAKPDYLRSLMRVITCESTKQSIEQLIAIKLNNSKCRYRNQPQKNL